MINNLRVYFTQNISIHYIDSNRAKSVSNHKFNEMSKEHIYYELQGHYTSDLEGLQKYFDEIQKTSIWLLKKFKIDLNDYRNLNDFILKYFLKFSSKKLQRLKIPAIDYTEFKYQKNCYNSGLVSIEKDIIGKEIDCFGYDFTGFYIYLLGNSTLQIPINKGIEYKLSELNFPLKYGYYHVDITNTQQYPNIYKVHNLSKNGTYTHYTLNFLKKNFHDIVITPKDTEYNAYIFTHLIDATDIFKKWYVNYIKLKNYSKNSKIIKRLGSSLHGLLCEYYINQVNDDVLDDYDFSLISNDIYTPYKVLKRKFNSFILIKSDSPYKHNLARIKSFMTAYGRMLIGQFVIDSGLLNDCIRIYTDSIVLPYEFNFDNTEFKDYFKPEKKSSGKLIWKNAFYNNSSWDTKQERHDNKKIDQENQKEIDELERQLNSL